MTANERDHMATVGPVRPKPCTNRCCIIGLGFGCLGLIAIVSALVVLAVGTTGRAISDSDRVARPFLEHVLAGRAAAAYALTAKPWRAQSSPEEFAAFAREWRNRQGAVIGIRRTSWYASSGSQGAALSLTYEVRASRRTADVTVVVIPEARARRVVAARYLLRSGGLSP